MKKDQSIPMGHHPIPPGLANEEPEFRTELDIPRDPPAGEKLDDEAQRPRERPSA